VQIFRKAFAGHRGYDFAITPLSHLRHFPYQGNLTVPYGEPLLLQGVVFYPNKPQVQQLCIVNYALKNTVFYATIPVEPNPGHTIYKGMTDYENAT